MKYFIKKSILFVLSLFLTFSVCCLYQTKVKVNATEKVKITVDEFLENKDTYYNATEVTYIVCGIINHIYLTNKDYEIYTFELGSLNPFSNKTVDIMTQMDSYQEGLETKYNGHFVYYGDLGQYTGQGKYIEFELDKNAYSTYLPGSTTTRGRVACDACNPTVTISNDFNTAIDSYKGNKVKTSMRFDYDSTTANSDSSTTVWTLVTSTSQIDSNGVYTFGEIYDDGASVKFTTDPTNYETGDMFEHSVARLTDNSFTIVYPSTSPAEFKITQNEHSSFYTVTYKSNTFNTRADYKDDTYRFWLDNSYGEFIKLEGYKASDSVSNYYLFKKTSTGSKRNTTIEYDANSVSIRFLSYINASSDAAIRDCSLVNSLTYGIKLSIEEKADQFIDFTSSEVSRVSEAGSNTAVLEGGVLQTILSVKGIPASKWRTNITATPYIKVVLNPYTLPNENNESFDFGTYYFYQDSVTWTVRKLAEDYYLNYGKDVGVASHLLALQKLIDGTATVRKAK